MPDSIRLITEWPGAQGCRVLPSVAYAQIIRQDPYQFSARMIARHELRIWFEPNWGVARRLARRFPYCLVCSIPFESDTAALHRVPGWRPRRDVGQV